jgi:MFS transporter, putative metabolite:H+ symporter
MFRRTDSPCCSPPLEESAQLLPRPAAVWALLIVSALGYFVDAFDLVIFNVVRKASLAELGIPADQSLSVGLMLYNWQMVGMLVGGVFWGVIADKRGRLTVLFGSIVVYSLANLLNAFVEDIAVYRVLRFVAGLGLAGELGVGVALVSEVMSPERRGLGTMVIAVCGVLGSTAAGFFGSLLPWRHSLFLAGVMGLVLLVMRMSVTESAIFRRAQQTRASRGSLRQLFGDANRRRRYLLCVGAGLPIYVVMGLLMGGAPELGLALGLPTAPVAGTAILVCHLSMLVGDVVCTLLSQKLRSRVKAFVTFHVICLTGILLYLYVPASTLSEFYLRCGIVGFGCGFWVLVTTNAAEQFGTNLRGTVATSVPNFVRGMLIPITFAYELLRPGAGLVHAAGIIGVSCSLVAIVSALRLTDKFGHNLDYVE